MGAHLNVDEHEEAKCSARHQQRTINHTQSSGNLREPLTETEENDQQPQSSTAALANEDSRPEQSMASKTQGKKKQRKPRKKKNGSSEDEL